MNLTRSGAHTLDRETTAGHQPRERGCLCGQCLQPQVWSVHGVCDHCGPETCARCRVAAA